MAMAGCASLQALSGCSPSSRRRRPFTRGDTPHVVCDASSPQRHNATGRRRPLLLQLGVAVTAAAAVQAGGVVQAAHATPLAPLGKVGVPTGGPKLSLSTEQVKDILADDLAVGQYFVTGKLTKEVFADDCRFQDPTNDIVGLARYVKALGILFDPATSTVELKSIEVTGPTTIEADWTLGGTLLLPWHPTIQRFDGHTVYSLNDAGLIQTQAQTWSVSAANALWQTFTPS